MARESARAVATPSIAILTLMLVVGAEASSADEIDFEKQILPIFTEHCSGCHGADKAAAKLRLHTAAGIKEKWEADEHLIVAGDPEKSELYSRLVLPADDKKRMPKDADPLPKEQIDLIAAWIRGGAALSPPTTPESAPASEPASPDSEAKAPAPLPLPEVEAAASEAIEKISASGATVLPLYAGSNLLQISYPGRSEPIGDAEIALLTPAAKQIHTLNLANAQVSAVGLAPLAALENLSILHLERSNVTDEALAHLSGLSRLEYLNLYGSGITDAGLASLSSLKHLKNLYLWQTNVSYDAAMALEKEIPGLTVNLGYDHPVVAKMRLTKELELVNAQAEEAKAAEAKAKEQHEAAKQQLEAANSRLADLKKQLEAFEQKETPGAPGADQPAEAPKGDTAAAN